MPCTHYSGPGFQTFVCSRGRSHRPSCSAAGCTRPSTKLCDFPVKGGTCDRPLCDGHAHQVADDKHFCPGHYRLWVSQGKPEEATS